MKQDEKGGKRSADGVGSACTPGACRGRLQETRTVHGPFARPRSSIFTGLGQRRLPQLRRALGQFGLSLAQEQSRNFRSLSSRMKHETPGKDPSVPPFSLSPNDRKEFF